MGKNMQTCNCSLLTLLASLHVLPSEVCRKSGALRGSLYVSLASHYAVYWSLAQNIQHSLHLAGFGVPCKICNIWCAMCIDQ